MRTQFILGTAVAALLPLVIDHQRSSHRGGDSTSSG